MWKRSLKAVLFVIIFCIVLDVVNGILIPKRKTINSNIQGLYELPENEIDVLFLGTSHVHSAISPMQLYDDYGIVSYVLSTDDQPFELSYTLISETLKSQNLKMVVLDMAGLMKEYPNLDAYQMVMNELPLSINKIKAIDKYTKIGGTEPLALLSPIYAYNNRWKELTASDFSENLYEDEFFTKGFNFLTMINGTDYTVEKMNQDALNYPTDFDFLDSKKNELMKIKTLCDNEGIELLAIKIPVLKSPASPYIGWTRTKSQLADEICSELGINYIDLMYDGQVNIEWYGDTHDQGVHLNYRGAKKTTDYLGQYIVENYSNTIAARISENFDKDLKIYSKVSKVAELQIETDFVTYLNKVCDLEDAMVILVTGGQTDGIFDASIHDKLHEMGVNYDTENVQSLSNIFLITENGMQTVIQDTENVTYACKIADADVQLNSSVTDKNCSIQVNNQKVNFSDTGVNIVVVDEASGIVLESVVFLHNGNYRYALRNYSLVLQTIKQYQSYLQNLNDN